MLACQEHLKAALLLQLTYWAHKVMLCRLLCAAGFGPLHYTGPWRKQELSRCVQAFAQNSLDGFSKGHFQCQCRQVGACCSCVRLDCLSSRKDAERPYRLQQ